ncbi:MAG: histidine phosphatase family protein, partial [Pseudomonadota bacterium]
MSTLLVIRHGQARFLTEDYDRLSELGVGQARALGEAWVQAGIQPTHAFAGSLVRQQATATACAEAFAAAGLPFPPVECVPELNEYDGDRLVAELAPRLAGHDAEVRARMSELEGAAEGKARYRAVHRLLETTMERWIEDVPEVEAAGLPRWQTFSDGVRAALLACQVPASGATVAVFTSGGPVGISVQSVLGAPEVAAAALNWRVINASVTKFTYSSDRISLDAFNTTAHLDAEQVTYR